MPPLDENGKPIKHPWNTPELRAAFNILAAITRVMKEIQDAHKKQNTIDEVPPEEHENIEQARASLNKLWRK